MYGPYPSTFDPILWTLKCTDASVPAAVDAAAAPVAARPSLRTRRNTCPGSGGSRVPHVCPTRHHAVLAMHAMDAVGSAPPKRSDSVPTAVPASR